MTSAIEIRDLVKTFGPVRALDGVNLTVGAGEVHGFLGPNGAGKSTTIRVLLGLLRADSGSATVLGHDVWSDAVALHRRLAYVPGDVSLWPNLTGGEAIDLFARLRGGVDRRRRTELIERFDLDPTKKGRTYSKGNRQKVAIVAALASEAELLLLDEPTAGLDPLMEAIFAEVISEEQAGGRTVLLSSHTLAQVERLCERISIIRRGVIVESGSLTDMRHLTRTSIDARVARPVDLDGLPGVHASALEDPRTGRPGASVGPADAAGSAGAAAEPDAGDAGGGHRIRVDVDAEYIDDVIGRLHGGGLRSLVAHPATLEQLFMRHYGEDIAALEGEGNGEHGEQSEHGTRGEHGERGKRGDHGARATRRGRR